MQTFDENNFATIDALIAIQCELRAPKGKRNNFGNFNYRSAEDILEAVKPLLGKHKCQLTLTDDVVSFGDRLFVRSIATLIAPDGRAIATAALAEHPADKKGMDASQITGSASSYARKYALGGLFLIDDERDADALPPEQPAAPPAPPVAAPPRPPMPPPPPKR